MAVVDYMPVPMIDIDRNQKQADKIHENSLFASNCDFKGVDKRWLRQFLVIAFAPIEHHKVLFRDFIRFLLISLFLETYCHI